MSVTILGCGSSGGVPRVGNDWGACDPDNVKNRRTRCAILVQVSDQSSSEPFSILIDTPPDLRTQLLANDIRRVDCVLYTHTHADQCHGIDDLRVLAYHQRSRIPVFSDELSLNALTQRFGYCFRQPNGSPYPPILDARAPIVAGTEFRAESSDGRGVGVLPLDQDHGSIRSLGFRIGDMAYCNDVVNLPETSLARLEGLNLLILDTLRYEPHPTHAHLDKALGWISRLRPKRAVLTNLHIDLDYETLKAELPDNVEPAYDGLKTDI